MNATTATRNELKMPEKLFGSSKFQQEIFIKIKIAAQLSEREGERAKGMPGISLKCHLKF